MDNFCVKIVMYKGLHADKVVYYRNKLPIALIDKWHWYFEWLTNIVIISNPDRKIELIICKQTLLQGEEYVNSKSKSLLKAKRAALKKRENDILSGDLFSFKAEDNNRKIQKLKEEIKNLENGVFNYYIPVKYINLIKDVTNKTRILCYRNSAKNCDLCHDCDTDIDNLTSFND